MAKNYVYNRSTVEKFAIKGYLSEDGTTIDYINSDKEEARITVAKCLAPFRGQEVSFVFSVKSDEDMSDELEEDEEI